MIDNSLKTMEEKCTQNIKWNEAENKVDFSTLRLILESFFLPPFFFSLKVPADKRSLNDELATALHSVNRLNLGHKKVVLKEETKKSSE